MLQYICLALSTKMRGTASKENGDEMQEEASQTAELSKLQRQLRVMENDRRSYAEEAQNYLRKQQ